ncbi:hypothetical protein DKM44_06840 [Deinococcus irradiatisoli]|uniref:DUF11 domain-containing protein n=1 Tax=Deinococcus irradiatisoli TaxID=2202254 RepID=A0A2Z3JJ81_9DEIO|nr:hypothetical protein [Deinococcus irradiatisoli]AWN22979.1 hypothetical protein DKM44_06840 [Deinococcus irradiatisoli]
MQGLKRAGLCLGLLLAGLAAAQGSPSPLNVTLTQDLIRSVTQNGKLVEERVAAPSAVLPGAVLLEEVTVQNVSAKALSGVKISVPVPKGARYSGAVTPSGDQWETQFSALCGGKALEFAKAPLSCTELVNGKNVTRDIKPNEYTQVRWLISSVAPGEKLKLSFRVVVN